MISRSSLQKGNRQALWPHSLRKRPSQSRASRNRLVKWSSSSRQWYMFSVEEAPSVLRANMAVPGRNPCHIPSKAVLKDELEKLKNMLNTVKALIARGKKYRDKLSKVIKDGHQKLMDLSEKLRVCTHFLFIPQQMGEYILEIGRASCR